jgi:hypothetical protein
VDHFSGFLIVTSSRLEFPLLFKVPSTIIICEPVTEKSTVNNECWPAQQLGLALFKKGEKPIPFADMRLGFKEETETFVAIELVITRAAFTLDVIKKPINIIIRIILLLPKYYRLIVMYLYNFDFHLSLYRPSSDIVKRRATIGAAIFTVRWNNWLYAHYSPDFNMVKILSPSFHWFY